MPLVLIEVLSHLISTEAVLMDRDLPGPRRQNCFYCLVNLEAFFRTEGPKHLQNDYLLAQSTLCTIICRINIRFSHKRKPVTEAIADLLDQLVNLSSLVIFSNQYS